MESKNLLLIVLIFLIINQILGVIKLQMECVNELTLGEIQVLQVARRSNQSKV